MLCNLMPRHLLLTLYMPHCSVVQVISTMACNVLQSSLYLIKIDDNYDLEYISQS